MASASGYNHHRFARAVLKKSRKWEPSLTVQLFQSHWRFENSPVNFQYDGPMKPFLLALRSQVIPTTLLPFLYDIQPPISFVDGCLVVELQDFRRSPGEVRSRVVMRPAAETLAQTIDVMLERKGQSWDETMALELESRIIAATSPPLYLGTSILATRNAVLALSLTSPASSNLSASGSIRSPSSLLESDSKSSLDKMRKLLRAGERPSSSTGSGGDSASGGGGGGGVGGPFQPNWTVLRAKEQWEMIKAQREREAREIRPPLGPDGQPLPGNGTGPEGENGTGATTTATTTTTITKKKGSGGGGGGGGKKKRPPPPTDDDETGENKPKEKPKKKKKTAAAVAAAAAAAAAEETKAETTEDVKTTTAPTKKKKAAAAAAAAGGGAAGSGATAGGGETKPKKKSEKKKKEEDAAGA
ncbi:hypothetical protein CI109_101388 [Kwoniella shandongensis]|uniref:Spt20-like SEP domain-containing protein n=1 Tax=Kwoniella shandongensis TaxID=1734106 RepID=A0AAJ8LGP8_9TREE